MPLFWTVTIHNVVATTSMQRWWNIFSFLKEVTKFVLIEVPKRSWTNRMCVCMCVYKNMCIYMSMSVCVSIKRDRERKRKRLRFILRNWLMWLWKLVNPTSSGWTSRLEAQGSTNGAGQVWRPSACRILACSVFCSIQTFSWLREAHLHYRGQSALF